MTRDQRLREAEKAIRTTFYEKFNKAVPSYLNMTIVLSCSTVADGKWFTWVQRPDGSYKLEIV